MPRIHSTRRGRAREGCAVCTPSEGRTPSFSGVWTMAGTNCDAASRCWTCWHGLRNVYVHTRPPGHVHMGALCCNARCGVRGLGLRRGMWCDHVIRCVCGPHSDSDSEGPAAVQCASTRPAAATHARLLGCVDQDGPAPGRLACTQVASCTGCNLHPQNLPSTGVGAFTQAEAPRSRVRVASACVATACHALQSCSSRDS